jgi:hypothetical protein
MLVLAPPKHNGRLIGYIGSAPTYRGTMRRGAELHSPYVVLRIRCRQAARGRQIPDERNAAGRATFAS